MNFTSAASRDPLIETQERSDPRIDAAIGAIGGVAGGLLGVGGGFVMVPLQVIWARRSQHRATGTSLAAILPIGVVGAATYYFGGRSPQTDLTVALFLSVGGVVGAFTGSLVARRISDRVLSMIFAILLVVVGLKEVYDALNGAAPSWPRRPSTPSRHGTTPRSPPAVWWSGSSAAWPE